MEPLDVARILQAYNPWWESKPPSSIPVHYRRDYFHLQKVLASPEHKALVISGPRQVGKTTLVRQLIQWALNEKGAGGLPAYEPKRIMYATPEIISNAPGSKKALPAMLYAYEELVLGEKLNAVSKDTLIFLDEIQSEENWAETIKPYIDANPGNLKFVITGSSRLSLMENSSEKLPGRHLQYVLLPLKFSDRVRFRQPQLAELLPLFAGAGGLREKLFECLKLRGIKPDVKPVYEQAARIMLALPKPKIDSINEELAAHLREGGYPEIVLSQNTQFKYERFKTYVSDITSKDLEHSRKPWLAQRLLINLAKYNAQELVESDVRNQTYGNETGSPATIQKYLEHLEQLAIIRRIFRNKSNKNIRQRKPKAYFCDTGLRNSMLGYLEGSLSDEEYGLLAETVTLDHLMRFLFKLRGHVQNVYFHKPNNEEKEVDFVIRNQRDEAIAAIEVKYRDSHAEIGGLRKLKEAQPNTVAIVLTKNTLKTEGEEILYLPLWMFLLSA